MVRGCYYSAGVDPRAVEPPVLFEDYFGDEVIEGDEYWDINGDLVLDENVREYIAKIFEKKVARSEDDI